jgi:hypothetical protein
MLRLLLALGISFAAGSPDRAGAGATGGIGPLPYL